MPAGCGLSSKRFACSLDSAGLDQSDPCINGVLIMMQVIARVVTVIRQRGLRRGTALLMAEKLRHEALARRLAALLQCGERRLFDGCVDERAEASQRLAFEQHFERGVSTVELIRCGESGEAEVEFIRGSLLPLFAGCYHITSGLEKLIPELETAHNLRL